MKPFHSSWILVSTETFIIQYLSTKLTCHVYAACLSKIVQQKLAEKLIFLIVSHVVGCSRISRLGASVALNVCLCIAGASVEILVDPSEVLWESSFEIKT